MCWVRVGAQESTGHCPPDLKCTLRSQTGGNWSRARPSRRDSCILAMRWCVEEAGDGVMGDVCIFFLAGCTCGSLRGLTAQRPVLPVIGTLPFGGGIGRGGRRVITAHHSDCTGYPRAKSLPRASRRGQLLCELTRPSAEGCSTPAGRTGWIHPSRISNTRASDLHRPTLQQAILRAIPSRIKQHPAAYTCKVQPNKGEQLRTNQQQQQQDMRLADNGAKCSASQIECGP